MLAFEAQGQYLFPSYTTAKNQPKMSATGIHISTYLFGPA
jgi:hypothetical protein